MTQTELPGPLREAAESVRSATRELIQAAEHAEAEAIERAIDLRAGAVQHLEQSLTQSREPLDGQVKKELLESLAIQAGEADSMLRRLRNGSAEDLRNVARGSKALRGYAASAQDPSALDRSG